MKATPWPQLEYLYHAPGRFILCVPPKCGCSTVAEWWSALVGIPPARRPDIVCRDGLCQHPITWQRILAASHKVIVVRPPLERLVSLYVDKVVVNKTFLGVRTTFRMMVDRVAGDWRNPHWRAQIAWHGGTVWDEYVLTARLSALLTRLAALGGKPDLAPPQVNAMRYADQWNGCVADTPAGELAKLDAMPPPSAFVDSAIETQVRRAYAADYWMEEQA